MTVEALCIAPSRAAPMIVVEAMDVVAGSGIVGGHYFGPAQRHPGQNLTLIEAEEVEAFNARTGRQLALTDPRRNIVTRGVRLNALVGKDFSIGSARFRGVELCEPCGTLAQYLSGPGMSKAEFIRQFTHRCGLRADVTASGTIRAGDPVMLLGENP